MLFPRYSISRFSDPQKKTFLARAIARAFFVINFTHHFSTWIKWKFTL